jgi:hypothetical protein
MLALLDREFPDLGKKEGDSFTGLQICLLDVIL